jgi:hypothetical protein
MCRNCRVQRMVASVIAKLAMTAPLEPREQTALRGYQSQNLADDHRLRNGKDS